MTIVIAHKHWGGCDICIDFKKIDFLPRFTLSEMTGCLVLNIGFLMLSFNLVIFGEEMRQFNKKLESGELAREMDAEMKKMKEAIKALEELKDATDGAGDSKDTKTTLGNGKGLD